VSWRDDAEPYELIIPGPVGRAIRESLPEAVALAVIESAPPIAARPSC
jgi:hypothetical protein